MRLAKEADMGSEQLKEQLGGLIRDARGRKVRQFDPMAAYSLRRFHVVPAETLESVLREIKLTPRWLKGMWIFYLILIGLLTFIPLSKLIEGSLTVVGMLEEWVENMIVPALIAGGWYGSIRETNTRKITKAMLAHLRCPHGGYDLHGLPPDPADKATVCPVCGCAWVVPPPPQSR